MKSLYEIGPKREHETAEEYIARSRLEQMAAASHRKVRGVYAVATLTAKTAYGGEVATASTGKQISNLRVAAVGDLVRYPDGREARITSGAGAALNLDGHVVAIVGSRVSNGDYLCSTPVPSWTLTVFDDDSPIGFLTEGYSHPATIALA